MPAPCSSTPQGVTAYIDADPRDPDTILKAAAQTLDFTRPIALMLMGILGHIGGHDEGRSIVKRLLDPLPSGSYLALNEEPTSSAKRLRRPSSATTKVARSPTISVAPSRSPASTGWSRSSLAWCQFHGGDPILPLAVTFPPRSMPSVA
jgi:S-adenosyl methyltransferase